MSEATRTEHEPVTVQILGFPLAIYAVARQQNDELMREFALLTIGLAEPPVSGGGHHAPVPVRLLALVEELSAQYGGLNSDADNERDAAMAAGRTEVDLVYQVPPQAVVAVERLGRLLDEADDYCRSGQHLLTLATPPEAVRFRRWYLAEFERQITGRPPIAWRDYVEADDPS